jgi:hypothetical protein
VAKYTINIVNEDCEVLRIIEVDTEEMNWNTPQTIRLTGQEIFQEIEEAESYKQFIEEESQDG